METPPRAWGRRTVGTFWIASDRNTPTGVGKTNVRSTGSSAFQKHPHGRGEDKPHQDKSLYQSETPPRAWGRLVETAPASSQSGNTPTGVGKTGS